MPTARTPPSLEPLLEFLNTLDVETGADEVADATALGAWLTDRRLLPADAEVDQGDHALALRLREDLRAALLAHDDDPTPAVSGALGRIRLTVALTAGGAPQLVPAEQGVVGALGRLVSAIPGAVADGSWARTKVCARETCRWAFYDGSRNRSRRWCSMEVCGNREKSRNFRDRQDARAAD